MAAAAAAAAQWRPGDLAWCSLPDRGSLEVRLVQALDTRSLWGCVCSEDCEVEAAFEVEVGEVSLSGVWLRRSGLRSQESVPSDARMLPEAAKELSLKLLQEKFSTKNVVETQSDGDMSVVDSRLDKMEKVSEEMALSLRAQGAVLGKIEKALVLGSVPAAALQKSASSHGTSHHKKTFGVAAASGSKLADKSVGKLLAGLETGKALFGQAPQSSGSSSDQDSETDSSSEVVEEEGVAKHPTNRRRKRRRRTICSILFSLLVEPVRVSSRMWICKA